MSRVTVGYQNEVHSMEGRIDMGDLGLLYTF